jgi:hypothetical protein
MGFVRYKRGMAIVNATKKAIVTSARASESDVS